MPSDAPSSMSVAEWLRHARSDLAVASQAVAPDILFETLCFHAQQAVEKSIKAVLLQKGVVFPYTHDIARLITLVNTAGIPWQEALNPSADLTEYAVETRYPRETNSVTETEYRQAIEIAERVVAWAESIIEGEPRRS